MSHKLDADATWQSESTYATEKVLKEIKYTDMKSAYSTRQSIQKDDGGRADSGPKSRLEVTEGRTISKAR